MVLQKPDGRGLTLYSRHPISKMDCDCVPSPQVEPVLANPHLRWHPLRSEWVAYADHRQNRTFLPPPEYDPLAPTKSKDFPTELPSGHYDVAVFDNLFPSMAETTSNPSATVVPAEEGSPANGKCEVIVFSQDAKGSLGELPLDHIALIIDVWAERTCEMARHSNIRYVMPFENRGVEMGVTLPHPHGQIYAYPFVPPVPSQELKNMKEYFEKHKKGLLENMVDEEIKSQLRVVVENEKAIAFIPRFARYPYETWLMPKQPVSLLTELTKDQTHDLASALKELLLKFDSLWKRPFPYLMAIHQGPVNLGPTPFAHLHFEFYPPLRAKDKLKYLAGTELAAGMFTNDTLPEEKAAELRNTKP